MTELHPPQGDDARDNAGGGGGASPGVPVRDIPQATVTRLATYLRVLGGLADAGTLIVSSEELATASGVGSAKLRKDLSFLGPNGVRGVGYDVLRLQARIENALGLDQGHRVVLVGVGNLGRALARYPGFDRRGFTMAGLFDSDPQIVGTRVGDLTIRHVDGLESGARELGATIGVVATPGEAAQQVCDVLVRSGVRSVLSFAPTPLEVPEHVEVRRVDLSVEMQVLSFNSARNDELAHAAGDARPTGMGQPMSSRATAVKATSAPHRASSGKSGPLGSTVTRNGSVIAP
ncbi:redox-sensing transcriptional repressor Rex [Rhodococcus sp. NPDC003382]|uniref:redox-sensing transcriptional repressor Rex n=1 Tax=unclassified Rhodococcus (in: high G+C Gram-positive bacteria) TaxID=192944 RepID=UPI0018CC8A5D|nr:MULTISPECIES: redox-sensing transcriptional repressor Rex [unclassified Rhodococcus (in: high G+C Gram-positive bacteria)]MBH0118616.1 redox-sensing transcriptional repressor Rex [Rhodococcus sp. CX]MCK8672613.1 redox-sensing transcriptional repressor Rex [Rhodococcus sp. HM1]